MDMPGTLGIIFQASSIIMNTGKITGLVLLLLSHSLLWASAPPAERQQELLYLLKHDCGSCHGMRLEGGLGPALTANRLQSFTTEQLANTILFGRRGTPMPPWQPFLTPREAFWLASLLKQGVRP